MIKKFLLIVTAIAGINSLSSTAKADVLDLPDFKSGKPVWIVRAGVSFNNAAGKWKEDTKDAWQSLHKNFSLDAAFPTSTGYDFSVAFNKSFGNHPVYWGMELAFGTRGYKANAEWDYGKMSSFGDYLAHNIKNHTTLTAYNVKYAPFIIGYKYTFLERMAVDVHAGAFLSYDFAGKSKYYVYDYQLSSNKPRVSESTTETNISDIKDYQALDAGMTLGVGYWFGHFNLDFTWQRGFVNMVKDSDSSMQAQSFILSLGYAF